MKSYFFEERQFFFQYTSLGNYIFQINGT